LRLLVHQKKINAASHPASGHFYDLQSSNLLTIKQKSRFPPHGKPKLSLFCYINNRNSVGEGRVSATEKTFLEFLGAGDNGVKDCLKWNQCLTT